MWGFDSPLDFVIFLTAVVGFNLFFFSSFSLDFQSRPCYFENDSTGPLFGNFDL